MDEMINGSFLCSYSSVPIFYRMMQSNCIDIKSMAGFLLSFCYIFG